MANNERLTKRVKKIEDWVAENEEMGGPKGHMDVMVHLYQSNISLRQTAQHNLETFNNLRSLTFDFLTEQDLTEEWDEFLQEKENAVQEQQAEEVPLQEETESGEETVEAPKEEIKD